MEYYVTSNESALGKPRKIWDLETVCTRWILGCTFCWANTIKYQLIRSMMAHTVGYYCHEYGHFLPELTWCYIKDDVLAVVVRGPDLVSASADGRIKVSDLALGCRKASFNVHHGQGLEWRVWIQGEYGRSRWDSALHDLLAGISHYGEQRSFHKGMDGLKEGNRRWYPLP